MDNSRVKNFVIILLALVNVFLLVIVISSAREELKAEIYRMEALESVLSENGIVLNSDIELPDKIPPLLSIMRDMKTERNLVSDLIGKCTGEDQGGNIYFYSGNNGQAKFRGTGEFELLLNSGVIPKGRNPVSAAKTAMKKMGIECSSIEPVVSNDGDNTTVTLFCSWEGTPIYNAPINFYFTSDYLMIITGTRPLDTKYSVQSSENYSDGVTVLMNFLESIRQTGDVCSEINDLKIVYYLSSAVSGDCTLRPVWCVQTDSGAYYINAQTGKAENIDISS